MRTQHHPEHACYRVLQVYSIDIDRAVRPTGLRGSSTRAHGTKHKRIKFENAKLGGCIARIRRANFNEYV